MELIKELKVKGDAISFKYPNETKERYITNVGFTEAKKFRFKKLFKGAENDTFYRICNGNILEKGDQEAYYILLSTDEKGYYLVKTDEFNNLFVDVKASH